MRSSGNWRKGSNPFLSAKRNSFEPLRFKRVFVLYDGVVVYRCVRAVIYCDFAVARYVVKVRNKFFRVFPLNYRRVIFAGVVKD